YDFADHNWYKTFYSFFIHPVPYDEKENEINGNGRVIPPPRKKLPGRPKSERMKNKYVKQEKKKIICSNGKLLCNHNSRTCPLPKVYDFLLKS
ncbi:hypothetical protein MKX03_026632, partial [Papaver bracteatum]